MELRQRHTERPPSVWKLAYDGFDPGRQGLREALCAVGNGYFVTCGALPEAEAVAADQLWMSMNYREESLALHFTWKREQDAVERITAAIEEALAPFHMRPHWGKLSHERGDDRHALRVAWRLRALVGAA